MTLGGATCFHNRETVWRTVGAQISSYCSFHTARVSLLRDLAQRWMASALLLAMGVLVGTIVILMYLPVFQMAGTVQ